MVHRLGNGMPAVCPPPPLRLNGYQGERRVSVHEQQNSSATIAPMRRWTAYFLIFLSLVPPLFPQDKAAPMSDQSFALGVHTLITGLHTSFPRQGWGEHLRYVRQMTGAGGWIAQVVQIT